jgi:hypothetical protein
MPGAIEQFLPVADVRESHQIQIAAPADLVFATACAMEFESLPLIRLIFRAREWILGARPAVTDLPKGLVAMTTELGWRPLSQTPGRELVMGAVTQPWLADVIFHGMTPSEFLAFAEPGWVKIVWTLEAMPNGPASTVFCTQTRVQATDETARVRFRSYWRKFGLGIVLIRWFMLPAVRKNAEREFRLRPH